MQIQYSSKKVERYFIDYGLMQATIGLELTKAVKKQENHLKASRNFSIYLSLGLGKPHPLYGDLKGCYGVWLTGNIRLIIEPQAEDLSPKSLELCDLVKMKGVSDYHGGKDNWLIP